MNFRLVVAGAVITLSLLAPTCAHASPSEVPATPTPTVTSAPTTTPTQPTTSTTQERQAALEALGIAESHKELLKARSDYRFVSDICGYYNAIAGKTSSGYGMYSTRAYSLVQGKAGDSCVSAVTTQGERAWIVSAPAQIALDKEAFKAFQEQYVLIQGTKQRVMSHFGIARDAFWDAYDARTFRINCFAMFPRASLSSERNCSNSSVTNRPTPSS